MAASDLELRLAALTLIVFGLGCPRTQPAPPPIDAPATHAGSAQVSDCRDASAPALRSGPCVLLAAPFPTEPGRNVVSLGRVCFDRGVPSALEPILEIDRDAMPGVHRVACIRQDRFLVLDPGLVIDLDSRAVIQGWKRGTGFVGCEDQRLITRRWQPSDDLEFFDFHSRASGPVEQASPWRVVLKKTTVDEGALSPDRRLLAYMDQTPAGNDALFLASRDAAPRQIASGFSFAIGPMASPYSPSTPFVWVDASRIVTQRSNGALVVVHLDGKVEPLVNIPVQTTGAMQPSLRVDAAGRVLYSAGIPWVVDLDSKRFAPEEARALGDGFEVAPADAARGKPITVRAQGKDVGQFACDAWSAQTTRGAVALACRDAASSRVLVWNVLSGAWSTIEQGPRVAIAWVGAF